MTARLAALLFAVAVGAPAQPPEITTTATADRASIGVAEPVRVTLTLEGPAPLRIEAVPGEPEPDTGEAKAVRLSDAAAKVWQIHEAGPATLTPTTGGRERWSQTFRLDPWPGGPLTFAPVRVNGREVTFPAVPVSVVTTIPELTPDAARPVTGVEPVPPRPTPVPESSESWPVVAAVAAVAVVVLVAVLRFLCRKPRVLPPGEWAAAELDRLERDGATVHERADRVAAVLRGFVERRFGIPATRQTTPELTAAVEPLGWPAESGAELRSLLEECDRARFAGDAAEAGAGQAVVARARAWMAEREPPGERRGVSAT